MTEPMEDPDMPHTFTPHPVDPDTRGCQTLLAADEIGGNGHVSAPCGGPRLSLPHAIPFDQHHNFDPGHAGVSSSCRAVVVEEGKVAFCALSTRAQVHQPVEPEPRLFPGPEVDGRPTWFCQVVDVPAGYQWRTADAHGWTTGSDGRSEAQWAQTRRRLPVPGDLVWVSLSTGLDSQSGRWVTFAEVCETIAQACRGTDPTDVQQHLSRALWRLLVDGEVPSDG